MQLPPELTVTIEQGSGDFVIPAGSNRGDFEIQIRNVRSDDVASGAWARALIARPPAAPGGASRAARPARACAR